MNGLRHISLPPLSTFAHTKEIRSAQHPHHTRSNGQQRHTSAVLPPHDRGDGAHTPDPSAIAGVEGTPPWSRSHSRAREETKVVRTTYLRDCKAVAGEARLESSAAGGPEEAASLSRSLYASLMRLLFSLCFLVHFFIFNSLPFAVMSVRAPT